MFSITLHFFYTVKKHSPAQAEAHALHVKTAKTVDEACKLAEGGFEHFDTIDGIHLYRKRK